MSVYKLETKEKPSTSMNKNLRNKFIQRVLEVRWGHVNPLKTDGSYLIKSCISEG